MRPSKRTQLLEAALRVVEKGGVTAVTFESVAEAAGVTKGGMLYHFPSREALLLGLHEHLAQQWEADMIEQAGAAPDEITEAERLDAYTRVATQSATCAEVLLLLESANEPAMHAPWNAVVERWTPPVPGDGELTPVELDTMIARLAADGLWLYDSLSTTPMSPDHRQQLTNHLARLAQFPETKESQ